MTSIVLDAMDLQVFVHPAAMSSLFARPPHESPDIARARVASARARQQKRLAPWGIRTNAEMSAGAIRATCRLDDKGETALAELRKSDDTLTAHSIDRIVCVARTIADLREQESIDDAACSRRRSIAFTLRLQRRTAPRSRRSCRRRAPTNDG